MPGSVLKSGLVYDTDATAKGIERMGDGFRPWNFVGNFNNFQALGISQVAEVGLLVLAPSSRRSSTPRSRKKGLFEFSRRLGAVERQEVMASQEICYVSCGGRARSRSLTTDRARAVIAHDDPVKASSSAAHPSATNCFGPRIEQRVSVKSPRSSSSLYYRLVNPYFSNSLLRAED